MSSVTVSREPAAAPNYHRLPVSYGIRDDVGGAVSAAGRLSSYTDDAASHSLLPRRPSQWEA